NGCTDTSECIAITTLGVAEHSFIDNVLVYPNPAGHTVKVDLGTAQGVVELILTDIWGKEIKTTITEYSGPFSFDIDSPPGVYLLRVVSGNNSAVVRLVRY